MPRDSLIVNIFICIFSLSILAPPHTVVVAAGFHKTVLPQALADQYKAYCLDGSLPSYYYSPASTAATNNSWVIYFMGGAFCPTPDACVNRSTTNLGSSTLIPDTYSFSGMLDSNSTVNPGFSSFHRVHINYCDGFFFTGNRTGTLNVNGVDLHFRGRAIVEAVFQHLIHEKTSPNLSTATEVLLGGGSAGGVACFLYADYVRNILSHVPKFKAAPVSGFFLRIPELTGSVLGNQVFDYAKTFQAAVITTLCTNNIPKYECWSMASTYRYVSVPIFVINSAYDHYALRAWAKDSELAGGCLNDTLDFTRCTTNQVRDLNKWYTIFKQNLTSSPKFTANGNGAFIESCLEHVAAESAGPYMHYVLNDTSLRNALWAWWESDNQPAASHTFMPCELSLTAPHQCQPSCAFDMLPPAPQPTPQPTHQDDFKTRVADYDIIVLIICAAVAGVSIMFIGVRLWLNSLSNQDDERVVNSQPARRKDEEHGTAAASSTGGRYAELGEGNSAPFDYSEMKDTAL